MSTPISYSVVTICLNCARTISRTIESVLRQDRKPEQYIFVLGDSVDSSREIVMSYKSEIENSGVEFILIHQNPDLRAGIPVAWNMGIRQVKSDIVAILNADDCYLSRTTMSRVMEAFDEAEGEVFILSGIVQYANRSKPTKNKSNHLFPILNPYCHPATFIPKQIYDSVGLYDESYIVSADYEFLYRVFHSGYRINIDQCVAVKMEPGGNASLNKKIGRKEAYSIASKYSKSKILPIMAYVVRFILAK